MFRINKRIVIISITLVIFIFILSNVVNAATQCEVDQIKHALRKMLYRFYSNPNTVPFSVTEVKDLLLFYLSIDSNAVTIDCSVLGSKSNKAIFDIINIGKNVSDEIPRCTDGTEYGQCSGNRPKYCYAGAIYEKCETCGCPSNSFCGKSGKCESTIQNITCYNSIDCGTNKFVGDYYCSYNSVYKNMINYTCVNPGTVNSSCIAVNSSAWLAYCYPNLNQICVDGQSTCQTNVTDTAPTVAITVSPTTVTQGQIFNVTVTGTDDIGLAAIWWWAVDSTDTELNKAHWYSCYNAKYCSNSWLVSTNAVGTIKLGANSRDTSYPIAGEAHQASEGAGIAYAFITVSGATNISNVSGGLPDLIISDFKSYTGTTNTYVTISATIKNIGGSVTEGNLCDSLYVETLNGRGFCGAKLNPGETRVIQSDYALPMPGTYKIRADTDYGLLVAESNENNNVAWQTITVTSPYSADYVKANTDLTVTDIDVQLPTTSSGQTNVYVTTKNIGSLATGQYWVYTKVTNQDTGVVTKVQRLAPVVEPGGTYKTHHGEVGIKEYGTYKVEAFVDIDLYGGAYIYESNEDNNYMVKNVVYGVTNATCTDSDGGKNYDVKGTVTYYGSGVQVYTKTDDCSSDLLLNEGSCLEDGGTAFQTYLCPNGCKDGACVNVTTISNLTLAVPSQMRAAMNTPNASMVPTVNFVYSATDISYYNIKSFRLYQKKPGESVFSRVAEFTNLPTTASSTGTVAGQWRLVFSAPEIGGWWAYKINSIGEMDYQPVANYPLGTYYYYTTAVDAFGRESQQSVTAIEHILEPVNILSPTTSQSPTPAKPTIKWTIATGWPFTPAHHIYVIDPALPSVAYWYKLHSGWDGSVVYDGPALDPTKKYIVMITARMYAKDEESYLSHNAKTETFWVSGNQTNQTSQQTCTGVSKTADFENPPHLSFHLTWNPDLGAQDSYNYNLDETARTWLKGKGLVINGTPNGIVWGTRHSGPAGTTGVVIGDASPNFVENDQGISDNEILSVRFIDALTKSVTVGLTVIPSNVSLINNIPATVTLEAYDTSDNIVGTATKTFTGVTNSVYTPTTMSLSATDFKIAKITLRTTQHPYGGVWLEDVSFLSCT